MAPPPSGLGPPDTSVLAITGRRAFPPVRTSPTTRDRIFATPQALAPPTRSETSLPSPGSSSAASTIATCTLRSAASALAGSTPLHPPESASDVAGTGGGKLRLRAYLALASPMEAAGVTLFMHISGMISVLPLAPRSEARPVHVATSHLAGRSLPSRLSPCYVKAPARFGETEMSAKQSGPGVRVGPYVGSRCLHGQEQSAAELRAGMDHGKLAGGR